MSSCQTFKDTLGKLNPESLKGLLDSYIANPGSDTERGVEEKLEPVRAFVKEYKKRTRELLLKWYPSKNPQESENFLRSISFEANSQRVIIESSMNNIKSVEYFPSLIKGVRGNLDLSNVNTSSIDGLEFVGGNVHIVLNDSLTTITKLKIIGGRLDTFRSVAQLPSLEIVNQDINTEMSPECSFPNIKFVGGELIMSLSSNITALDALEEVGGNFIENGRISSMQSLRRVGSELWLHKPSLLEQLPSLEVVEGCMKLTGVPTLQSMTDFFPKLRMVGTDSLGFSFFVDSETIHQQLLELQKTGKLMFAGTISHQLNN